MRGFATVLGDPTHKDNNTRVLYLQFLDLEISVIEDNANDMFIVSNTYSEKIKFAYSRKETNVCDAITVSEGFLQEETYALNVFEDERLLASTEFQLK